MTAVVRVLGPFRVRRDGGTWLDRSEWRTSHAVNLVRILAVSPHQVRPAAELAGLLWPGQGAEQARTALRGALAEARRLLGAEHLVRRGEEIALADVWVDAQAFRRSAAGAIASSRRGDHRKAVAHAFEALSYRDGPLAPDDPAAEWAAEERIELARLHVDLLLQAGEDALEIRSWDTARDLAEWATQEAPHSERAARTLLRAAGALGRTDEVVSTYTRLRERLGEDLGVGPSALTEDLYRDLLRGRSKAHQVPFVGRRVELEVLTAAVGEALASASPTIVHVVGPRGAGKTRLLDAFARTATVPVEVSPGRAAGPARDPARGRAAERALPARVVVIRDAPPERLGRWAEGLLAEGRQVVLMGSVGLTDLELPSGVPEVVVPLGPMDPVHVRAIAESWLGDPVTDGLHHHLMGASGSLPGPLLDELAALSRSLRLGYEEGQLALLAEADAARLSDQPLVDVDPRDLPLLDLIDAAGDRGLPIVPETVAALDGLGIDADESALHRLETNGVLVLVASRVWLSGAARVELRRLAPEPLRRGGSRSALVTVLAHSLERLPHLWDEGGDEEALHTLELATRRLLRTATTAEAGELVGIAEQLLLRAVTPSHAIRLHTLLADLYGSSGDDARARAAAVAACRLAEESGDPGLGDLRFGLASALVGWGDVEPGLAQLRRSGRGEDPAGLLLRGRAAARRDLEAAEDLLGRAAELGQERGELRVAAEANIHLASRIHGPGRRLEAADAAAARAVELATVVAHPGLARRAATASSLPLILAGVATHPPSAEDALTGPDADERAELAPGLEGPSRRDLAVFHALARHDLGLPLTVDDLLSVAGWRGAWPWSSWRLRLLVDRGQLAAAGATYGELGGAGGDLTSTVDGLYAVAAAVRMLCGQGRHVEALGVVTRAIAFARASAATLVLPALLRCLVALARDTAQAAEPLAELSAMVAGSTLPGDAIELRRAEAALAALAGDAGRAADLASGAAELAFTHGLVFAAADALEAAGSWLRPGAPEAADEVFAHARDLFRTAAADVRVERVTQQPV